MHRWAQTSALSVCSVCIALVTACDHDTEVQRQTRELEQAQKEVPEVTAQLEKDLQSRAETDRASLAVLEEKRNKARLQMDNAQKNIENMTLRAPFDGLVAVKDNDMNNAAWAGVVVPEFRAGDTVYPGRQVAEVLHQSGIELIAKVSEYDRAAPDESPVRHSIDENLPSAAARSETSPNWLCGSGRARQEW